MEIKSEKLFSRCRRYTKIYIKGHSNVKNVKSVKPQLRSDGHHLLNPVLHRVCVEHSGVGGGGSVHKTDKEKVLPAS